MSYSDVARAAGIDYIQAVHHLQILSDGRAGHTGIDVLSRREEADRRYRTVAVTDLGVEAAGRFVSEQFDLGALDDPKAKAAKLGEALRRGPLPAIQFAAEALPSLALGTFAVLLEITRREASFAYHGVPAKVISEHLGISNFAKHLSILGPGLKGRKGLGLIESVPHPDDRRIKLPRLTAEGHRFVSSVAARVCNEERIIPKRAKLEKVIELANPDQISGLDDADFDLIFDADDTAAAHLGGQ